MNNRELQERDEKGEFSKGNSMGFSSHPENINKDGRPPRPSLTRMLNEILERGINGKTGEEIQLELLESAIEQAKSGNAAYLKEIWARLEGKVPDRIAGHDGGPINKIDEETRKRIDQIVAAADRIDENN